jgi:hypothetical protein
MYAKLEKYAGNISPYVVSYLEQHLNQKTRADQVWVFALQNGFPLAMVCGGYLERRFGPKVSGTIGSLILT